tara:strand:- start:856 stop:1431 length:576 start_codon:yes stop_codon:yes gene_type:complete
MNRGDFEYDIKKDIRNNPIVREVDEARNSELWRALFIGILLVVVLIFTAWQHFELRQHNYEISEMQQQRMRELEVNRHLRLEIETLRSPARIERIATEQLGLVEPTSDVSLVIERVVPAVAPDPSVVVDRRLTNDRAVRQMDERSMSVSEMRRYKSRPDVTSEDKLSYESQAVVSQSAEGQEAKGGSGNQP